MTLGTSILQPTASATLSRQDGGVLRRGIYPPRFPGNVLCLLFVDKSGR
jgi:hypothetical protein